MNPAQIDAEAFANEAWVGSLPFVTLDTNPAVAVDLTDMEFALQLRRRPSAATVDLAMSTATGELFVQDPPTAGVLAYDVPVDRVRLLSGTYAYDLVAWPASRPNEARVWMEGQVVVNPGVTR